MKHFLYISVVIFTILVSCEVSSVNPDSVDLGQRYYPNEVGNYWEYYVEGNSYAVSGKEALSYYLREEVDSKFENGGDTIYVLNRYYKDSLSHDWSLDSVWNVRVDDFRVSRTENNVRHVNMVFPLKEGMTWEANVYNLKDEEFYTALNFQEPFTTDFDSYDNTVRINQGPNNTPNLVSTDLRHEVYAKDIGLVYKFYQVLEYQPPVNDTTGLYRVQQLINWGN